MHSLQPCQLGSDSLLNMGLYPLLNMRGGASLSKPLELPGGFGVAPVKGVSGVATTGRIWAESRKIPLVIGGIRTGNLALSKDVLNRYPRRQRRCSICMHPLTALRMQHAGWIDDAHHSGKLPAAIDV